MDLNVNYTSMAFFILSATIAILLPLISRLADCTENQYTLMFTGLIINAVGLMFLAPSSFIPLPPSLGLSLISLEVIAIGYALAFIPTFENILNIAVDGGLQDNLATYGVVSGLWSTMYALGEVTGPTIGGSLLEFMDFSAASSLMALFSIIMVGRPSRLPGPSDRSSLSGNCRWLCNDLESKTRVGLSVREGDA